MKTITAVMMGLGVSVAVGTAGIVGDDFNDNSIDPAKWGETEIEGDVAMTETNQRLEYTANPSWSNPDAWVEWDWLGESLSYTEDWSISMDLGLWKTAPHDSEVYFAVGVEHEGTVFEIDIKSTDSTVFLQTYATAGETDLLSEFVPLAGNEANILIEFDAQTKRLFSSYNVGNGYIALTNFSAEAFGMTKISNFTPVVFAGGDGIAVGAGQAYADNFRFWRGSANDRDLDADGLPDAWEIQHFGSVDAAQASADSDPDGDGQDNAFECAAGLVPTDALSRFLLRIESVAGEPAKQDVVFSPRFPDRTYTVKASGDLIGGSWDDLVSFTASDDGEERTVTDENAGGAKKFYRVEITKP